MNREEIVQFEYEALEVLKEVIDPEIEINIVDLGLVYDLTYDGEKRIDVELTFSTPACPMGETIISGIEGAIKRRYPDFSVQVNLVFDPPWNPSMISEEGRMMLG